MSVTSILKTIKIIGQRKAFYRQRIPQPSCARKETVDINILVTSRNDDKKIMQSITITSRPSSWVRKWNQPSQFRWASTKVIPIKKRGSNWRTNSPAYPFLYLIQQLQVATSGTRYRATLGKEPSQNKSRLKFSWEAVLAIMFFFLKNRPIHFHINSTIVSRPVK